jgi:hypothetical protein
MVRYTVKPDAVALNEQLVREVYEELADAQPDGFRYATFTLDDGVSFVHVAEHADGANPLATVAAFGRFQESLRERCDAPPVLTELSEVGSYRFFDAAA